MKRAFKDPIVVAILIAGAALTIGLAMTVRNSNEQAATLWLTERAELIQRSTESTVERSFGDLDAVAAFLDTSETMSQSQFARFVEQMNVNPGVIGIGYVEIVTDAEIDDYLDEAIADVPGFQLLSFNGQGGIGPSNTPSDVYYPLRYVHGGPFLDIVIAETPIESQIEALGFDVATEPLWSPEFEDALALPTPSVSDLVSVGGVFEEQAFTVSHPMADESGKTLGILVAPGLEMLLVSDLGVSITSKVSWQVDNAPRLAQDSDWPIWQRELDLPGSAWTLTVAPTAEALSDLTSKSHWLIIIIGLGLTALLVTTALQLRLRRREQAAMSQLQKVAADKDRFLATVSHELRTPLTVVVGLSHELADRADSFAEAERTDLLQMIGQHSEEASAIVEDLLVAARSDIDKLAVHRDSVDLLEAVKLALATSPLPEASLTGDPAVAYADPQRVRQILRNLFTNANKYGGPEVEVRFTMTADQAVVTVADDGSPITAAQRKQIFDPYTSAHENGDNLGSIGLGLFISLKLARLMGGDLRYWHDGAHSLFTLYLPLAQSPAKAPQRAKPGQSVLLDRGQTGRLTDDLLEALRPRSGV